MVEVTLSKANPFLNIYPALQGEVALEVLQTGDRKSGRY